MLAPRLFPHFLLAKALVYAVALVSSLLVPHGEQAAVHFSQLPPSPSPLFFKLLRPLVFYDGDFFVEIAVHGYRYDKSMAFFPGFPLAVKALSKVIGLAAGESVATLIVAGFLLNCVLHWLSVVMMGRFLRLFPELTPKFRGTVQLLMVYNPIGLYFQSFYSEALFLFLQTSLLLFIAHRIKHGGFNVFSALTASLVVAVSGFGRSNGFLSAGFIAFFFFTQNLRNSGLAISAAVSFLCGAICVLPFVIIQIAQTHIICANENAPFCNRKLAPVYGMLQTKYWDATFMTFVEGRRPTNLLYAVPILLSIYYLAHRTLHRFFSLQKLTNFFRGVPVHAFEDFMFPSAVLLCLLFALGVTNMHFNSFNRVLAGYPFFYIFLGALYESSGPRGKQAIQFWGGPFQALVAVCAVNNYIPL